MDPSIAVALVLVVAAGIALEIGFSSAIAEILAGVALGYFIVGVESLDWVRFLGNLGLLGLMFLAGFEVDINRLRRTWRASAGIGVLSLTTPMVGVFTICFFGIGLAWQSAGLMAIGLSTTSLALVYHALRERGDLAEDFGQVVLGAATVIDVLSMVALALLLGDVGWGTAIVLLVVAISLKFLGTAVAARWLIGQSSVFVGLLFNYRLSFGIITATVGKEAGLIDEAQYSIILLIIVCSALLPALFLRDTPNELDRPDPKS